MPPVRRLALDALGEIFSRGVRPKEALERLSDGLEERDRAFLMELTYGLLRRRDTLDWLMGRFLKNPRGLGLETTNNLRLGVYQIFFLRVPDWAAVNEAVRMEAGRKGLVNAVLRNVLRAREDLEGELDVMRQGVEGQSLPPALMASYMALLTSHPLWLLRRWISRLGPEEAYRMALANNEVPPLTLRVNTLRATREEVIERLRGMGIDAVSTAWSPVGLRLEGAHAFREIRGLEGLLAAQDEAAQLVTLMLGPRPGERVLDACAAPGGKTSHIAQMMEDNGEVVAVERDEKRIRTLRENISAMGLSSVKVVHGDVAGLKGLGRFERVLVDAPCSSTGVIRRNPDVKYRHGVAGLRRFKERQGRILASVAGLVKPGGTLLYSTCSTEPEEGEDVLREFLKSSEDFYIIKDAPFNWPFIREGVFRTYPGRDDMDGFFSVSIRRNQ